ncbi:MAG: TadE/TadG family type IV pilus assembly protein [Parvularculaceae bacterium]
MSHISLNRFARSERGNMGMMFALLLVPLLIACGMAVDLGRKSNAKAVVQEAADMAVLRVARMKSLNVDMTDAELTAAARTIFDAATANRHWLRVDEFAVTFDPRTDTFNLAIDADLRTALLGIVGYSALDLKTLSSVNLGKPPYMEVALVLDNTGSMNSGGKLGTMKTAAAELVEAIYSGPGNKSKVALVPFSQYVNVGSHGLGRFWMRDSGESARGRGETTELDKSSDSASADSSGSGSSGSGVSGGGSSGRSASRLDDWNGCVGSRPYPANTDDAGFAAQPAPEVYDGTCPNEIHPLTRSKAQILKEIEDMEARGNTYIAGGLEWGWHALTNASPFREGMTLEDLHEVGGVKVLVVLTDGDNTVAPSYPEHESEDRTLANSLMMRLCQEIKADEIVVYSIAFGEIEGATRSLLEECASSTNHYFEARSSGELAHAFQAIGASLRSLSLSK